MPVARAGLGYATGRAVVLGNRSGGRTTDGGVYLGEVGASGGGAVGDGDRMEAVRVMDGELEAEVGGAAWPWSVNEKCASRAGPGCIYMCRWPCSLGPCESCPFVMGGGSRSAQGRRGVVGGDWGRGPVPSRSWMCLSLGVADSGLTGRTVQCGLDGLAGDSIPTGGVLSLRLWLLVEMVDWMEQQPACIVTFFCRIQPPTAGLCAKTHAAGGEKWVGHGWARVGRVRVSPRLWSPFTTSYRVTTPMPVSNGAAHVLIQTKRPSTARSSHCSKPCVTPDAITRPLALSLHVSLPPLPAPCPVCSTLPLSPLPSHLPAPPYPIPPPHSPRQSPSPRPLVTLYPFRENSHPLIASPSLLPPPP